MATNKKITELTEVELGGIADDDVLVIVDISENETKKVRRSTLRTDLAGVATLAATSPLAVDASIGDVTVSISGQVPVNNGGTGASTAAAARTNLGLGTISTQDYTAVNIDGGAIDGTPIGATTQSTGGFSSLTIASSTAVTSVDTDLTSVSASDDTLASAKAIKTYVDAQVGTVDTLSEILANGNTTGANNIIVTAGQSITVDTISETTAAGGVTVDSLLIKDGGITAAGTSTFAGQTISNLGTVTTADINGGTIDGTTIGASSAAAGTFTTLSLSDASEPLVVSSSGRSLATFTSTDATASQGPNLVLKRDSASPAVSDVLGQIIFQGEDSASNVTAYGQLGWSINDPTDTSEDGAFVIKNIIGGTLSTVVQADQNGWNFQSYNITTTGTLDAGDATIGSSYGGTANTAADDLIVQGTADSGITIGSGSSSFGRLMFADTASNSVGRVQYNHSTNTMELYSGAASALTIDSSQRTTAKSTSGSPLTALRDAGSGTTSAYTAFTIDVETTGTPASTMSVVQGLNIDGNARGQIKVDEATKMSIFADPSSTVSGSSLVLGADGNEALTIDSSQNVGIGTTSIEDYGSGFRTLEIAGSTNTEGGVLKIATSGSAGSGTSGTEMIMYTNSTSAYINVVSNHPLRFYTNNTERMRIDTSGNVGIGTTSSNVKVQVGNGTSSQNISIDGGTGTAEGGVLAIRQGGTYKGVLGTTAVIDGAGTNSDIRLQSYSDNIDIRTVAAKSVTITTNATTALTLDSSQNATFAGQILGHDNSTAADQGTLHMLSAAPPTGSLSSATIATFGNISTTSNSSYVYILAGSTGATTGNSRLYFGDYDTPGKGYIGWGHSGDAGIQLNASGSNDLVIDTSGNIGIGTTSPDQLVHVDNSVAGGGVELLVGNSGASQSGTYSQIGLGTGTDSTGTAYFRLYRDGSGVSEFKGYDIQTFIVNGAERMRIDSSGNFLVSKTAIGTATVGVEARATGMLQATRDGGNPLELNRKTSDGTIADFRKDGTTVGTISVTGSATAYNTSSDYRLKENVTAIVNATERLKQLNPVRFNFIADANTTVDGFLAHEVSNYVPEAVTGEKDAVDADGNPEYQGIDQSKLVPLLVATIKELEARITALES